MIDAKDMSERAQDISALLRDKLGARGGCLSDRLARAGRQLPKRVQRAGQVVVAAEQAAAHPKLARTVDQGALHAATRDLKQYLAGIDPKERRKTRILQWLAGIVANLLLIVVLVIVVLNWRDLL